MVETSLSGGSQTDKADQPSNNERAEDVLVYDIAEAIALARCEAFEEAARLVSDADFIELARRFGIVPDAAKPPSEWHRTLYATAIRSLSASPVARERDETAWLIEWKDGDRPIYWSLQSQGDEPNGWTGDANKALRFARQVDAAAYIEDIGWTEPVPVEHMWTFPPRSEGRGQGRADSALARDDDDPH